MAYNNLTSEQMFAITNLKEMYESNNRLLTSVTQITNSNFNNDNITSLINNLISTNNQIKNNIMNLLNTNSNVNNRQSNTRQTNHRQHNYGNRSNYHSNRQNYLNNPTISNLFYTFFDPIEIFPTPSQIEVATRVVQFGNIIRPLNSACPITLENFNDNDQVLMIRHCNHIFSNTALISWFRSNCRCPVCRYDIRNYVSRNTNNISDISDNVDLSSNILPSSLATVERNSNSNSNELINLLFSNLLDNRNLIDISGNNLSSNNLSSNNLSSNNLSSNTSVPDSILVTNDNVSATYSTDISGNNLLRFFFHS
jgi:hypothetical protein